MRSPSNLWAVAIIEATTATAITITTADTIASNNNNDNLYSNNALNNPLPPYILVPSSNRVPQISNSQNQITHIQKDLSHSQSESAHANKQLSSLQKTTATAIATIDTEDSPNTEMEGERHSDLQSYQYIADTEVKELPVLRDQQESLSQIQSQLPMDKEEEVAMQLQISDAQAVGSQLQFAEGERVETELPFIEAEGVAVQLQSQDPNRVAAQLENAPVESPSINEMAKERSRLGLYHCHPHYIFTS